MNKYSHIMIGELIYEYIKKEHGIHLEKESFIRGNVIPDFSYYAIAHPHFMKLSLGYVQAEIESLSNTYVESALIGSNYSLRLGIICHYYADFFCFAHSSGYKQVVVNHLKYEHLLYKYFQDNFDSIAQMKLAFSGNIGRNADEINEKMKSLHAEYTNTEPSYSEDLNYALLACAETILSLTYCSSKLISEEPLENYSKAAAV
ncbi:MAG: zinc dependent phospholipase C family protein [Oscillospiraceae bacterium]